jgi:prepilin-type N-terminal cleavage/methylation domain-containing protein
MAARLSVLARARVRAARRSGERGYTLIELLTAMTILSTVLGALTVLFVSGAKAELDLNKRFQAQHNAALALKKLRGEIHCAREASTTGDAVTVERDYFCRGGEATVIWCTASIASGRFGLFRADDGSCDASDAQWADFLTQASIFTFEQPAGSLEKIGIVLPVDLDPDDGAAPYRIEDAIVLRNSQRAAA